jgi:NAD(P)-dependent dehydrogenase (short-subunit alcohol dehydrogenase family)
MTVLEGKVAIVTGSGRGIGARYCRGLAAEGARVVVADAAADGARQVADDSCAAKAVAPILRQQRGGVIIAPERLQARIFKREQTPDDLVGTAVLLCSDASAFITGQTFNVDGGTYL